MDAPAVRLDGGDTRADGACSKRSTTELQRAEMLARQLDAATLKRVARAARLLISLTTERP